MDIAFLQEKKIFNYTHFQYIEMTSVIQLFKIKSMKNDKYKSNISRLFQNTYFLLSGQLCPYHSEVSHTIHYKLNSLALIYQQTLKNSLSPELRLQRAPWKGRSKQLYTHIHVLKVHWQISP